MIASPVGTDPLGFLGAAATSKDGHNRHGAFDLTDFGSDDLSFTAGGADVSVTYANRDRTPKNLDPSDTGHDYGDYGAIHRITFTFANPTGDPHVVYLYERPLGGPVRSTFIVDGVLKELGCVEKLQRYLIAAFTLPPGSNGSSTVLTMTDGGSFYPIEVGATLVPPIPNAPPQRAPDGCFPAPTPTPSPSPLAVPTQVPPPPLPDASPSVAPVPLPT